MTEEATTHDSWRDIRAVIPILAATGIYLLLNPFTHQQRMVGAIFAFTVAMWMLEILPLGLTALISSVLLVGFGGFEEKEVFVSYGDVIVPLFIGSFIIAKAMENSGLSDRFAWLILSKNWATKTPKRLLFSLGAIACVISLFVSNTATTVMLLPVGLSMLSKLGTDTKGQPFAIAVLLMLTWGSSVAVGVPVGTPPNLIAVSMIEKETGTRIGFLQWMGFAMPVTVLMLIASWVVLWVLYRKGAPTSGEAVQEAKIHIKDLGRFSDTERNTLIAFLTALVLWVGPDLFANIAGTNSDLAKTLQKSIPPSTAALVGAALLFVLPVKGAAEKAMTWKRAATIDWGTILLFGGGIALGTAMFKCGLAKELGNMAAEATGAHSTWAIAALCTAAAVILSELASNTAAATVLMPVSIALAQGAGVNPIPAALGVGIGASLGFMLPVSTAPNAVVYSSGLIPGKQMMKAGIWIDIVGFFVVLGCLYVTLPLLGLG